MNNKIKNRIYLWITNRWMDLLIVAFSIVAWGATFLQLARGTSQLNPASQTAIFVFGVFALAITVWLLSKCSLNRLVSPPCRIKLPSPVTLILLGVGLRITWVLLFPTAPSSDGAVYLSLAHKLLNGEGYSIAGSHAYWPVGYPLFLFPWIWALPDSFAIPASQISLFVISGIGVFRLSRQLAGEDPAKIALLLLTVWPNLIAQSATPEKEMLILAMLPWVSYWTLYGSNKCKLFAGMALGAAVLTQPSLQLLIPAFAVLLFLRNGRYSIPAIALFFIGAIMIIAPWTVRNFYIFNTFKLVSTNGGDVMYRANNPLATGAFTKRGEVDLSKYDELEMDRKGKELATLWIKENPLDFVILAMEKQILFMGDDAVGIFATFRSDGDKRNSSIYIPLKLFANLWWLIAWLWIARQIQKGSQLTRDSRALFWGWIYLFSIHSVFESAGKYHVPMIWILCILLAVLSMPRDPDTDLTHKEASS